jgi:hypothetical protein
MPALANQHYVWAHYLKAWAEDRFFCWRQSEKKLFPGQPKVVANERDFYRTCRLTDGDLRYLRTVVMAGTRDDTRRSNEEFVRLFQLTYTLRDVIAGSRMAPDKRLKIEDDLSEAERTMGEIYHTRIEGDAIGYLDELRRESCSFYDNDRDCSRFLYFLCNQYFRTAKIRNGIHGVASAIPGHDHKRTALIESHIYASNVGMSLFAGRKKYGIAFLENKSTIPLITGDQPVFNLLDPKKTDEIEFYYPLSPSLAMLLTEDREKITKGKCEIGKLSVESYNHTIYRISDDQLYSNDEDYLKALTKLPKELGP